MKFSITILFCFLFYKTGNSQDLIKRVDSLVRIIESEKNLSVKINCDTPFSTISYVSHCSEFYSTGNLAKIINRVDRFGVMSGGLWDGSKTPLPQGILSIDIFYFRNDTLIKAIRKNFDWRPVTITELYFEGNELKKLEVQGLKNTDQYKHASECIELAYSFYKFLKK